MLVVPGIMLAMALQNLCRSSNSLPSGLQQCSNDINHFKNETILVFTNMPVKAEKGMGVMGSILAIEVAQHCRIVCAVNLHNLKEIFKNVWAFAIAIDAGNNA